MAYDEDLANRIRELVLMEDGVAEQRRFGGLAFLINGNMSVTVSGRGGLLLRVDSAETAGLLGNQHAHPFGCAVVRWMDGCGSRSRECAPSASSNGGSPSGSPTPGRSRATGRPPSSLND